MKKAPEQSGAFKLYSLRETIYPLGFKIASIRSKASRK